MVSLGSLASLDLVAGMNKRDNAKAGGLGDLTGEWWTLILIIFFKKVKSLVVNIIVDNFVHFLSASTLC